LDNEPTLMTDESIAALARSPAQKPRSTKDSSTTTVVPV